MTLQYSKIRISSSILLICFLLLLSSNSIINSSESHSIFFASTFADSSPKPDFTLSFDMTYTRVTDNGDGMHVYRNVCGDQSLNYSCDINIFGVWQDTNNAPLGLRVGLICAGYIYNSNKVDLSTHFFKLVYATGTYFAYMDGKLLDSCEPAPAVAPNAIDLGHPLGPSSNLPFPENFSSTRFDAIDVTSSMGGSFFEDFGGSSLNVSRWAVNLNNGIVTVSNSYLYLTSNNVNTRNSFPDIYTVIDPFLQPVSIDIKRGDSNPISLKDQGVLPIVIYGSATLDVKNIDPSTLHIDGAGIAHKQNNGLPWFSIQVNQGDGRKGIPSLVAYFRVQDLVGSGALNSSTSSLTLSGSLWDGVSFEGIDTIWVVP